MKKLFFKYSKLFRSKMPSKSKEKAISFSYHFQTWKNHEKNRLFSKNVFFVFSTPKVVVKREKKFRKNLLNVAFGYRKVQKFCQKAFSN